MKRELPESPLYRIFRETPPEELKEFFAPAMRAAKEDQKAISARAKAIRAERETAATSIIRQEEEKPDPEPGPSA